MCDTNISALYKQDKGALKWVTETVYMPMLINKQKKSTGHRGYSVTPFTMSFQDIINY